MTAEKKIDAAALVKAYSDGDIDLVCVLGPTASGKTRYAVGLAGEIDAILRGGSGAGEATGAAAEEAADKRAEIISADSRQVYRDMTIGTGKDLGEYGSVPYHLIDIVPAGTKYNIYEYQRDFEAVYSDIRSRGAFPILCGGSGLYIEAATRGYSLPEVPADPVLRAELEKEDTETLIARLASLKQLHNSTDYDTRQRLIRALEIAIYEQEHPVKRTKSLPKNTYYIGVDISREERIARIDARLDARLEEGLIDEVKALLDNGIPADDLTYYGLEYKFVTLYLTDKLDYGQMREQLAIAIHQFAKRQMTWFRGMERKGIDIHWIKINH